MWFDKFQRAFDRPVVYEVLVCVAAAAVGWVLVGSLAKTIAGARARGVVAALRLACSISTVAIAFRMFGHHDAEWFAYLGDYLHPVLTLLSLLGLATALYYQRLELRETQRQSTYARHRLEEEVRRYRLSDASFVSVNEIRFVAGEYRLNIVCGGAAIAMNVRAGIAFGVGGSEVGAVSRAAMLPGEKVERTIERSLAEIRHPEVIVVSVRWLNVHGMQLSYRAQMTAGGAGFWRAPERVDAFVATAEHDEHLEIR